MRVLVTGAGGFVGQHLVETLIHRGYQVYAGLRKTETNHTDGVMSVNFDITVPEQVYRVIRDVRPDVVVHLAAQSLVSYSWKAPTRTFMINTIGTMYLLEAIGNLVPAAKIIVVGSAEEYGLTAQTGVPLTEEHPCYPQNPYAISKLAAGQFAIQWAKKENLNLIYVRPFNHFGPGQREGFVVSDFASQIARIEKKLQPPFIEVGDLSPQRDFTDVRDVVEAYVTLLEKTVSSGIYNVCSGTARSINEVLNTLLTMSRCIIEVKVNPNKYRPSEVPLFLGSHKKLQDATGWMPRRDFYRSLQETLDWWRTII
jgi:Nucleoside-diphosphate-sugar epimerases